MARVEIKTRINLRERRKRRRNVLVALALGSICAITAGIIGVTWLPFMRATLVDATGMKTVQKEKIQNVVQGELAGTYGYLVPKNNILLYPRSSIEKDLQRQFPVLATADVHAENFHTIRVSVTERVPAALWCGEKAGSSTSCFLADQNGVIYAPAVVYSGDAYQRYFGGATGGALPRQFLTPGTFHALSVLADTLEHKENVSILSIEVDEVNDVRMQFSNGFMLIFALSDDTGDVLNRFALALSAAPFTGRQLSDFQYLDLRFGTKLYYKLKNQ